MKPSLAAESCDACGSEFFLTSSSCRIFIHWYILFMNTKLLLSIFSLPNEGAKLPIIHVASCRRAGTWSTMYL